jgi:guanylate kinase
MIFILPPSDEELLRRLRGRAQDQEAAIERRFAAAKREIELARTSAAYDASSSMRSGAHH